MSVRSLQRWLVLGVCACAAACGTRGCDGPAAPGEPREPRRPLAVQWSGCAEVFEGPRCALSGPATLRLWVASEGAAPRLALDGVPLDASHEPSSGGTVSTVAVPPEARLLTVDVEGVAGGRFELPLVPQTLPAWYAQARALRGEGRLDEAQARLEAALATAQGRERGLALGLLGRLALSGGEGERAVALLEEAIASHRAEGALSRQVEDALVQAFVLTHGLRRFEAARQALADAEPAASRWPEGAAQLPYYRALVAAETGDVRSAMRDLAASAVAAEQLGLARHLAAVRQVQALTLLAAGRTDEAVALLERMRSPPPDDACGGASLLSNLGWARVAALESGRAADVERARGDLEEAARRFRTECPDAGKEANALTNLAVLALHQGAPERADALLASARKLVSSDGRLALWWLDLEGRTRLAAGDLRRAREHFRRLRALAEATASPEAAWRAHLGLARTELSAGAPEEALAAYARAGVVAAREAERIPIDRSRGAFLGERFGATQEQVRLLLSLDRGAEAFQVVRFARRQVLVGARRDEQLFRLSDDRRARWDALVDRYRAARADLDAEASDDWKLSSAQLARAVSARASRLRELTALLDEAIQHLGPGPEEGLRPPGPGEVLLGFFPLKQGGWVGFAADSEGTLAQELAPWSPEGTPEALSAALLQPFARKLGRSSRITVLAWGQTREIAFHALPLNGEPLIHTAAVTWSLDVRSGAPPAKPLAGSMLLVADPTGDLPGARVEGGAIRQALSSSGVQLDVLEGAAASRPAVLSALTRADHLHFAGHATFAGEEGFDSALRLADGILQVGDVLSLPSVPRTAVLSACESGRSAELGRDTWGVAQAMVAAGSSEVIASTRPVPDALARDLLSALYQGDAAPAVGGFAERLRRAQRTVHTESPDADWAAFRVLTQ